MEISNRRDDDHKALVQWMAHNQGADHSSDIFLLALLEFVAASSQTKLNESDSYKLALSVVDNVRHAFGGQQLYISKGRTLDSLILKNKVWNEFTGQNQAELASKYNVSLPYIYRIVQSMRLISRISNTADQPDMFPELYECINSKDQK
ncbi:Mor transcription activator family protein [Pseudoalteromonas obscura]|uniref:Mor transcription activator family protein n=1 Tax=Pseudoalteromonas obscura TaxID=3048491 RepID=A0ABT7EU98_9GAMM|nr:Mor transcription activator family protein [Pseudoalteromonas sp. P94(2023)]MDK2598627.1 Mor transcription activator family protein [Pseudoalteromonas sp. P94(2023)]